LRLLHHSAVRVNARYLRCSVRVLSDEKGKTGHGSSMTCDVIIPDDQVPR
jgi:hypothetical protein